MPQILVTPTRDIHLILGGEPIQLRVRIKDADVAQHAGTSW